MNPLAPSIAHIDLQAYADNLGVVRRLVGPAVRIIAVVKANAYGHGAAPVAQRALAAGADQVAVAMVEEGVQLRAAGITAPILVLVQPAPGALPAIIEHNLALMISNIEVAEALGDLARRANRVASVHCKIDTGMGRQGFTLETAVQGIEHIARISHLDIVGVATHFANADVTDDAFTYNQIRKLRQALKDLERGGVPFEAVHAANSAAVLQYHDALFDAVRVGLMTYGVWPATAPAVPGLLQPVLRWVSQVAQVRALEAGANIGYGCTYTAHRAMRVAVVPVGYADGYRVALSNKAQVLLQGIRCSVRGRVSMDQIVVDISALPVPVKPGDPVVLIGQDGTERITVEELADLAGTIPYEILTGIGSRVTRAYAG
jgi:alanine racemase